MTTSSSDRPRAGAAKAVCTRISPSAVLDDQLQGKELEWARDHLLRCDDCRGRVEEFREMLIRVGRLTRATIAAPAIEQAYAIAVPDSIRALSVVRPYEVSLPPVETEVAGTTMVELTSQAPAHDVAEVAAVPDSLSDLEREIFRDTPWEDHPEALPPAGSPFQFAPGPVPSWLADPAPAAATIGEPEVAEDVPPLPDVLASPTREVSIESHQPRQAPTEPVFDWASPAEPEEPVDLSGQAAAAAQGRGDNALRIAVGLGAAACVLLAALLYESGDLFKPVSNKVGTTPHPSATASTIASGSPSASPSASLSTLPSTSAPVVARVGDGAVGESVFRIRPGTALPTFTRLVFDLTGSGLPAMVVTRPGDLQLVVTFQNTGGATVPVGGIHSIQVSGVEPAVQQGPDLVITVDLNRPVRPVVFTLPPSAGYHPRLVLDLYSN